MSHIQFKALNTWVFKTEMNAIVVMTHQISCQHILRLVIKVAWVINMNFVVEVGA